jgi:hypothetical protein
MHDPRFAALAEVEDEARIVHHVAAETGRGNLSDTEECFNFA